MENLNHVAENGNYNRTYAVNQFEFQQNCGTVMEYPPPPGAVFVELCG